MLTTHVVSQGLAEEMRASGWPQDGSTFYWYREDSHYADGVLQEAREAFLDTYVSETSFPIKRLCSAPLASELGEMLPDNVHNGGVSACLTIQKTAGNFWTAEYVEPDGTALHEKAGTWLPDALASLWLHLKKEGLLK